MAHHKNIRSHLLIIVLFALLLAACGNNANSQTPDVFNPDCTTPSLISAINQANTSPGPSVINLGYCLYTLTEVDNTITVGGVSIPNGLPVISSEITIQGNSTVIEIQPDSGEPDFGHFFLDADGDLELYDLMLTDGVRPYGGAVVNRGGDFFASGVNFVDNAAVGDGSNKPAMGGAIYSNDGRVRVIGNSIIQDNYAGVPSGGPANLGGGIYNKNGTLVVADSTFNFNQAAGNGGAIYSVKTPTYGGGGTVTIEGTDFYENEAAVNGGGIALINEYEGVFLTNSFFNLNLAGSLGGALYSEDTDLSVVNTDFFTNNADYGGAVFTRRSADGVLSVANINLSDLNLNQAGHNGGAIFSENSDLIFEDGVLSENTAVNCGAIQNGGSPTLDINSEDLETIPRINSQSQIQDSNLNNNAAQHATLYRGYGGALCHVMGDLWVSGVSFLSNSANSFGGGALVLDDLEMMDSEIKENEATYGGGMVIGIFQGQELRDIEANVDIEGTMFAMNRARDGYGAGLLITAEGTTNINKTTFDHNLVYGYGGAIFQAIGDLFLTNSTFSSNWGAGALGISGGQQGVTTGLNHVTIAYNNGGGIRTYRSVNLSVYKSLFYQNYGGGDAKFSEGTFLNGTGNVIYWGPAELGTKFPYGTPMIGPLKGFTHPVLPDSPLIDFLSSCGEPDDQRTVLRPQGTGCEPGAYEYNGEDLISADIPDFPELAPDLNGSLDPCAPFVGQAPDLLTHPLPSATMNLPLVLRVEGQFPGIDPQAGNGTPLTQFSAKLGEIEAYQCGPQGFTDRLICMFHITDTAPGMALDFSLFRDGCGDPIFTQPLVAIPQPTGVCQADLEKEECEEVGGAYLDLDEPYCLCP